MNKKPNIVLFITDSQGWNLLGKSGNGFVDTPNIDRLAEEGVLFNRAYTTCPLCTPARAGLFTGQYSHNAGAWANDLPLGETVKTIGSYFKREGYRTAYIGKWHLDGTDYFGTGIPANDYQSEYWYDGRNYLDELSVEEKKLWRSGLKTPEDIHENGITREFTWGGRITDRAQRFITENSEQPYIMVVSYDEPHSPSTCPPPFCDMYKDRIYPMPLNFNDVITDKPEHHQEWSESFKFKEGQEGIDNPLYFGCASFVDSEIGRVLKVIDQVDKDNTIVIFTSDHGHYLGAHKLDTKGPALYEEVVRVPLIFRGPGIAVSKLAQGVASHIDIIPTLLDFAGLECPPILEGKSMKPTLENPSNFYRDEAFIEFNRFSVTHDSWFGFIPIRSIVTEQYKLVINLHYTDELYDLSNDPGELHNLILNTKYSDIREELHRKLMDEMNRSRDPFRGPVWEERHWSKGVKQPKLGGLRRMRPYDGFLPEAYNYDTGMPNK